MKMKFQKQAVAALLAAQAIFQTTAHAQSLWREDSSRSMIADKRAAGIGDILTVLVQENSTATKKNNTTTAKDAALDASVSTFLYGAGTGSASALLSHGGQMPAMKYGSKNSFTGGGTIDNSQNLVTSVAVTVMDVLPNRNLVIEGHRETSFSGEKQSALLHGIVRPEDILANNTIFSYNIADAKVEILSKGAISDSQRRGWFTYVWNKLTPF
jgi:flagellar L-ring protein precursor FlgH